MTKEDIIAANPVIKIGINDGVIEVSSGDDYDNYINLLFEAEQAKEKKASDDAEAAADKAALLAKLGITADEAKLLLS
jgi:hypothetical protein